LRFLGFEHRRLRNDWRPATTFMSESAGSCLFDAQPRRTRILYDTALTPRDGDLVAVQFPSGGKRDEFNTSAKRYLLVDGIAYAACRFFAIPVSDFARVIAVVATVIRWPTWWPGGLSNAAREFIEQERERVRLLRKYPPVRSDLIIFRRNLDTVDEIRAAIRAHTRDLIRRRARSALQEK
jgi:hypothetical protein